MEEKVLEILKDLFELDGIDENCSQETIAKWDSMGHLNLMVELEMAFDVSFEPYEMAAIHSFGDIIQVLKQKGVE